MKKIAKISLVAAVAVAGLTTANAQPLEEAIKNVDVSGSVVYRYNDYNNDLEGKKATAAAETQTNNYKVGLNLASKVNDDVKFNSRLLVASATGDFASLSYNDNEATADKTGDINPGVTLSNAYFGFTGIKNTTVNVGKQGLTTPWTKAEQIDGNEQTGTGILALSTVGPVTLAGAYFNQTNLNTSSDAVIGNKSTTTGNNKGIAATKLFSAGGLTTNKTGDEDIATVGVISTLGLVTLDAWYLDAQQLFDTYTIGAKVATKLSGIELGADARYVSLEGDKRINPDGDKNTLAKIAVTADAGLIDGKLAYAKTGSKGGLTALDNDATSTLLGWNLTSNGKQDADYYQAVLGIDILSNLNLSANYGNLKYKTTDEVNYNEEEEEIYAQLLYKMSKNLTTYVRYGTLTNESKEAGQATIERLDSTVGRLQVSYTF